MDKGDIFITTIGLFLIAGILAMVYQLQKEPPAAAPVQIERVCTIYPAKACVKLGDKMVCQP